MAEVVVVGAGLAGLSCARLLTGAGYDVTVIEASDGVGGRVRTDDVDGFRCDRGFQILLTAYPETQEQLDEEALDLRRFTPGALLAAEGRLYALADPRRAPTKALATLRAPIGTWADKAKVLPYVLGLLRGEASELLRADDRPTLEELADAGFSETIVDRLFRPLFAGIQLDPELAVSSRFFTIILRMLAAGDSAVPNHGMQRISEQLASHLDEGQVLLHRRVERLDGTTAVTDDGERHEAAAVVVATEGPVAAGLTGLPDPGSVPVAALWFAADQAPTDEKLVVLDGDDSGPVKNFAVMSNVAPGYAPPGRHCLVAAVPGRAALADDLEDVARGQLRGWFGEQVRRWDLLADQRIRHGHPDQRPPFAPKQRVHLGEGIHVCGDHRDTASIQGALYSGRRAARSVMDQLGGAVGPSA